MDRGRTLLTTSRASEVDRPVDEVWAVVASGERRRQWYVDAAPLVFRGAVDRAVGGHGRVWPPPGTPLLRQGDRAGFWEVVESQHDGASRTLLLTARVRAPGLVQLATTARPLGHDRTRLEQVVSLRPRGLLGAAYLLADLPAREAVMELTHRAVLEALAHA